MSSRRTSRDLWSGHSLEVVVGMYIADFRSRKSSMNLVRRAVDLLAEDFRDLMESYRLCSAGKVGIRKDRSAKKIIRLQDCSSLLFFVWTVGDVAYWPYRCHSGREVSVGKVWNGVN